MKQDSVDYDISVDNIDVNQESPTSLKKLMEMHDPIAFQKLYENYANADSFMDLTNRVSFSFCFAFLFTLYICFSLVLCFIISHEVDPFFFLNFLWSCVLLFHMRLILFFFLIFFGLVFYYFTWGWSFFFFLIFFGLVFYYFTWGWSFFFS